MITICWMVMAALRNATKRWASTVKVSQFYSLHSMHLVHLGFSVARAHTCTHTQAYAEGMLSLSLRFFFKTMAIPLKTFSVKAN